MWNICRQFPINVKAARGFRIEISKDRVFASFAPAATKKLFRANLKVPGFKRIFRRSLRGKQEYVKSNSSIDPDVLCITNGKLLSWGSLVRPAMFTFIFGAGSFGAASVWRYENSREETSRDRSFRQKLENFLLGRKEKVAEVWEEWFSRFEESESHSKLEDWKNQLVNESLTDHGRVFISIFALNVIVFCMWRIPSLQRTMLRYFSSNISVSNGGIPMLLSAFSHHSALHLAVNMFALHSFCDPMVSMLGKEQFVALYLTAAVFTSFCSHLSKVAFGKSGYSLGASGAILCIFGTLGTLMPDTRMQIVFLPAFTFTAAAAVKGLIALDTMGLVAGWTMFDHAAHLGGVLMGIWYCIYGQKLIWDNRLPLIKWWHEEVRGNR